MLPPDYLAALPDAVVNAIDAMMDNVLAATAKRISKYGWTDQSQWEADRLKAMGALQSDIKRILKKHAPEIADQVEKAFQEAIAETVQQDKPYYEAAGMWNTDAIDRAAMDKIIRSGLRKTAQTFTNLTGTLAKETAKQFTAAMDMAWLAASTGTITPQEAGYRAIQQLCRDGIKVVTYPSGHQDTIEVATRRALLTGINQTALNAQDQLLLDLGGDLVEVTAHAGARPSHAEWQGKVFSRWGKTPGYVTLEAGTGFGTGPGLGGWNCRHSYHPFFEGYTPAYTQEQLEAYNAKKYTYNGKALTEYEAMQQQRYFERGIRRWKQEYLAAEAGGYDSTEAAVRLKQWRARETDFLKQTGRRRDSSRSQVGGFSHSQASKATWTYKSFESRANALLSLGTTQKNVTVYSKDHDVVDKLAAHKIKYIQRINDKEIIVDAGKPTITAMRIHAVDNLTNKPDRVDMTAEKAQTFVDNAKLTLYQANNGTLKFMAENGYAVLNFDNELVTAVPQKWRKKYNDYLKEDLL